MPQLLLELLSEEIPARMQAGAAKDLDRLTRERLSAANLPFTSVQTFAGPRRLTLVADGLPLAQADRVEERKGPRVGAPEMALEGFLRSAGAARDSLVERDGSYFATLARTGRPTASIIAEVVPQIVASFPWPKSMTWGNGTLRWVRPLKGVLCVFDRCVVEFEIGGLVSGDLSEGHRFMGLRAPFRARDFDEYREALGGHFVVLEADERKRRIEDVTAALCADRGLAVVEDAGLLDEVAGMIEWPVPILGAMDAAFLDLPPEVIRTSMRTHQRYFAVRSLESGALAPHFITVANIEAGDGGALIAAGNARVLAARLEDARFFWQEDQRRSLESRLADLAGVAFHAKLGTMLARTERLESLARKIAPLVGADRDLAGQAARLSKADLSTAMVGEFPELQGIMGGYYARSDGLAPEIAAAITDHYRPQGPSDASPSAPVTLAVAIADKLDSLMGFFSVDERPTGSRDPFALRRQALGVIRMILENDLRTPLGEMARMSSFAAPGVVEQLLAFFADRLKVLLRDRGARHDLVDAVFALGDDDLVRVVTRIEALSGFLNSDDGQNLLAGYKRAVNILNAESLKGGLPDGPPNRPQEGPAPETALFDALVLADPGVRAAVVKEDFSAALTLLAQLRAPVDRFFDEVLVNSPNPLERANRLRLLAGVRDTMSAVADFALVAA
jgi:glycyl-tRNA synthetase beta chain